MKSITTTCLLALACVAAALGCKSTAKQPTDPYSCRIPAPATYSYSPTILGQQPSQSNLAGTPALYSPQGAATTYPAGVPAATVPTTTAPAAIPVSPSPTIGPLSSAQPASIYGSLSNGTTIYPTAATSSTATTNSWTATQAVPSTYSSETATRNMDALAAAAPIASGNISSSAYDTWSTSSAQVATQVSE